MIYYSLQRSCASPVMLKKVPKTVVKYLALRNKSQGLNSRSSSFIFGVQGYSFYLLNFTISQICALNRSDLVHIVLPFGIAGATVVFLVITRAVALFT